ncbi:MAG TPA: SDR family oxidoreductase [Candidatus Acidoferrales bacterium]|nr:SDR family oxidoreductase [Candidatus Acidoferrales bacterium]
MTLPPRPRAVVTGASGGLGAEFAKLLARDGYDLVLMARSREKLERLAASLRAEHGVEATPFPLDLSMPEAVDAAVARVPECDVLVNNAGFATYGRFDRIAESRVTEEVMLDVVALTRLARAYLPGMIARRAGKILNVASTAGFLPGPFMAVYYASKAYVISFSQALSNELAGTGVTATCFAPGATRTGFAERAGVQRSLLFRLPVAGAAETARAGYDAMVRGKTMAVPRSLTNVLVGTGARFVPRRLLLWISRKAVEGEGYDERSQA